MTIIGKGEFQAVPPRSIRSMLSKARIKVSETIMYSANTPTTMANRSNHQRTRSGAIRYKTVIPIWRFCRVTKPAEIIQATAHSTITTSKTHWVGWFKR